MTETDIGARCDDATMTETDAWSRSVSKKISTPLAYAHALELIETFELRRSQEAAAAALHAEADSEFTAPLERQSAYGPGPNSIPADPLCFLPARELSVIRDGFGLK